MQNKPNFKTLLLYPKLGSSDAFITYPPLSLIYAAADSVKRKKNVSILDLRFYPKNYLEILEKKITPNIKLVGISVMTGSPIKYALEISRFLKTNHNVSILWGGIHPTLLPEETLKNKYIDYVIAGYGSTALAELINALENNYPLEKVVGLYYKKNGKISANPSSKKHELIPYEELPYHLVDMKNYFRKTLSQRDIPIFTSLGCPHQCIFCVAPVLYKSMEKKWVAYEINSVIQHIKTLIQRYQITSITVFDDDSFIDIKRMIHFFKCCISSGISKNVKINFRGVRINELDAMNDKDIALMVKANVGYIMIGIESGSQRILDLMKKKISLEAIKRVSKKLSLYPEITPHYNFFVGMPGETKKDLLNTKELLLELLEDNPHCYLGFGSDWKPIPGSQMTAMAKQQFNLQIPATLENWAEIDSFDARSVIRYYWYSKDYERLIRLIQCSSGIIDLKLYKEFITDKRFFLKLLSILSLIYRPIIMWRIKHSFSRLLIEFPIRNWLIKHVFTKL